MAQPIMLSYPLPKSLLFPRGLDRNIKKEFGGGDEESMKVVELKRIEQRSRMMEEFV